MERGIEWRPGIGDPSVMGWITVLGYLVAASLCEVAGREIRRRAPSAGRVPLVWRTVAALFLLLAVNKQLDLQSLLTDVGRWVVDRAGWMDHKRSLQLGFILATVSVAVVALTAAGWTIRRDLREFGLLFAGVAFTLTFVVVRAVSFHHVDHWLGSGIGGVRMNWILELSGIGVVSVAAAVQIARARHDGPG